MDFNFEPRYIQPKIRIERSAERQRRDPRLRKMKQVRRSTNDEILHRAMLNTGRVKLNIPLRIWDTDTNTYAGWHDSAVTLYCPDDAAAKEFEQAHRAFILQYAREHKLPASYVVVDQAKES